MDDQSTAAAPEHFILLTRYGDEGTPEYHAWNSKLPTLFPGEIVGFGGIQDAVDDARKAAFAGKEFPPELTVKVAEGTELHGDDVLDLIEANGGPQRLGLSGCKMSTIDLSAERITQARKRYVEERNDIPPWISPDWDERDAVDETPVSLRDAHLRSADLTDAKLTGAEFMGADLTEARLNRADLGGAQLTFASIRHADLREANLEEADLGETNAQGADFSRANLQRAGFAFADLSKATFDEALADGADFARAELPAARMMETQLKGAKFYGAHFAENFLLSTNFEAADFELARLERADLYAATSLFGIRWLRSFLDRTRMRRDQLGHAIGDELWAHEDKTPVAYRDASEAYLNLKNNFNSIGRYDDAAWAYVKEQQMEKMAYHWEWRTNGWRIWRAPGSLWRWLRNWAYELLTGYGERFWLPALWAIAVILAFAVGYAAAGNISPDFAGDPATAQGSHNFLDALTHSIGAFATIGFNTLEPLGWGARLVTAIESALGISLFALFIFTLGNRMSRS